VTGWPQSAVAAQLNTAAVGDINGDGKSEVFAGSVTVMENVPVN
jgi:hypothetical protein